MTREGTSGLAHWRTRFLNASRSVSQLPRIDLAAAGADKEDVRQRRLVDRGRRLEYLTVGWTLLEAGAALAAALASRSAALLGFGGDSSVEAFAGAVLLWRLRDHSSGASRDPVATRLVGCGLLLLAISVTVEAARALADRRAPDASLVGMTVAAVALVVMPLLAREKRRVAQAIGSRALHVDAGQTVLCAVLSAITLAGVGLRALAGWWWADPVAALALVPLIAREGVTALRVLHTGDALRRPR